MRRSKSNPAKYARNYRKISQRHMTGYDGPGAGGDKELQEKKRLEAILKQSEQTWKRGLAENGHSVDNIDGKDNLLVGSKKDSDVDEQQKDGKDGDDMLSLLSPELREQFAGMGSDNLVILPGKKKQKSKTKELPPLTPEEIKAAKALYKNTQRKLNQLEQRRKQKELRKDLYKQLEENTLITHVPASEDNETSQQMKANSVATKDAHSLLLKSSELGKKVTKKQLLKQLRRKEEVGIPLTKEEMGILYVEYDAPPAESLSTPTENERDDKMNDVSLMPSKKKNKKNKKRSKRKGEDAAAAGAQFESKDVQNNDEPSAKKVCKDSSFDETARPSTTESSTKPSDSIVGEKNTDKDEESPKKSFAELMFSGLSSLKTKSDSHNAELAAEKAIKQREEEEKALKLEEEERKRRKAYIPSETVKVSTMRRLDANVEVNNPPAGSNGAKHRQITRPKEVEDRRFDLPVSAMEFEIMDAVRANDCTILCSETGSGKSTQIPQFLYEAGFSSSANGDASQLLIGITQPRRVAAVSTAKRVCYEMGQGNGYSIKNDNIVAYQTRYETAGIGPSTHVKFMTDGILLQEIQSDLLLRKYGSIVIDEAHERNLNTDVLLGLLSVALPLRRKAAEEGSLPPLKLVIMSATLRVEDFTENERLFPDKSRRPALVKVPGRTYSVSIHHSKVTELDDYENAAMDKVCKIHRKLPEGGILCFLTGKQEIVRMVNRLRQRLEPRKNLTSGKPSSSERYAASNAIDIDTGDGFRDMDDDEADGDLFQKEDEEHDDFDDIETNGIDNVEVAAAAAADDDESRPKKVRILPLYSMISAEEQAKVFAPVPEDTRLIVIATNIAETSITIPGISYVVDSGRKKERNYHAGTGIASYDVMWISKAAADQRAGRAGRTGPGHCYRLYSSSVYSRVFDQFAMPEVLTRPLEDIVLAMKTMNVSNVTQFPFPTPPEQSQINAAVRLLANLGCVDVSKIEEHGGDGKITTLGRAVSQLPLGVRYGKMLLVGAQANVLDYAITLVAVLSEATPFAHHSEKMEPDKANDTANEVDGLDEVDRNQTQQAEKEHKKKMSARKWNHNGGDVLAAMMAVGAYAYADSENSDESTCRQFCDENGLNLVVMQRITKLRLHLCKLAKARLPNAGGVAAKTGRFTNSMAPPNRAQDCVLRQAIASGLLDNIVRRAPPGALPTEFSGISRSAYISGNSKLKEPLYIDNNSNMHSSRPEWVCYDSILRKKKKDGTTVAIMQRVTPLDPEWLAELCHGSNLLKFGATLSTPIPRYAKEQDAIQCAVETKFGSHGWEVPPLFVDMYDVVKKEGQSGQRKQTSAVMPDDSYRWFARYLFEGKVFLELSGLLALLNDEPSIITRRRPSKKVTLLVSALSQNGIDSAAALQKHWAEKDNKFLFKALKPWIKKDCIDEAKKIWITVVKTQVERWRKDH